MLYVVDTHPLIWFLDRPDLLSPAAAAVLRSSAGIVIPSICLLEVWHLYHRGRIGVSPAAVRTGILASVNVTVCPLDEAVLGVLPVGLEIHDAVVVATAIYYRDVLRQPVTLVTKDRQVTAGRFVGVPW